MLLPIVFEQLRAATRRAPRHSAPAPQLPAPPDAIAVSEASEVPDVPDVFEVPAGIRYQLFRALRAMARGQRMLVQHRLPALPVDAASREKCRAFLSTLRDTANWRNARELEAIFVPGTGFPAIAGPILLRSGWCAPSEQPHHIPNLRTFFLTERGYETLEYAWRWWSSLGFKDRVRLMLTE
jgi:hypothetical protein